ncbi:flocculation protein FLO11 [Strongylocentrotus purpuratus]|uniref:C2H2-type domain-containing protein n=1 Tax=Strongylocentrotus purpuratus TaxID=7668 RepID=A0A7M7RC17_STRPU|nr:flocculation protein FLO11 [Strongylocentrotus purpuratus]|eukprot:XP_782622.2 PREDICTED: flocculation protein FLO11 [Strongylocentrotus purpuratus]
MADAEGVEKVDSTPSDPDSETQDDLKQQGFNGENTTGTKEGKSLDLLSEALSKMDESGQEDDMNFSAAAGETADANTEAPGSGVLNDHDDKQDSGTVIPEAEQHGQGDGEAHSFPEVVDQDQMLIADSTSTSSNNGLIDDSIASQADCLTSQIDSESSKIDTGSSALALSGDSAMSSSSNNVLSDIAASSLLGSIATMIDSGSECSLTDNTRNKDGLNILEMASASSVGTTPTCIALTAAPAASPISLNLARSVQNTSLLVNGNSLLTGSSNIASLGTSLLNTPGLVQAISQQQTAPITSVPTLRVASSTPSPVTITVRTPPGTGALSQTLISNIVNTPEVQALLAKNPGQPITIVRVPDAPATVTTQSSTPAPAPLPAPAPAPAPVSAAILTPSQTQGSTIPLMKVVTNVTNKLQTPVRTFPPGTVLSNRLSNNGNPTTAITRTTSSPSSALVRASPSPKPAIVLGVKKKFGRGGGKAAVKGMAPAVPSSRDLHLLRQKRPANCKTRSGRVSRPPLYRIKEYKTMSNEELGDQPGSSDGEYSDYDETETGSSALSMYNLKRKYKCQNCEKRYIGKGGLARHYRENPTHGDPDSVFAKTEDEDQQFDERQSDEKDKQEEKTPSEADEKSNGDQSPKAEAEDEKPCSSEQTSKEDEQTSPVRPKPAIITYHYTPRTGPYKPRGRGRGRGRPPGSGRKVIDQSEDSPTVSSNSKDVEKEDTSTFKFFDPKSPLDEDLIKVTLPMLCKVIKPWEYTVARAQQTTTKDAIFPTILKSLKEMHTEARKMATSCLERISGAAAKDHSWKGSETQELLIEDDTMAKVLGVETGRYRFKNPSEDALPKTVRLLSRKQEAVLIKDKEQKQPRVAESVGEALQRKRRMGSPARSEPPSKKTPGTISILSPSRSASTRLTTPTATSSTSAAAKRVHTIGNIASIADVPLTSTTTVKPAAKRPIPPLGPISSKASKGLESNSAAFESSPTAKTTSATTTLPPLKPIKTKPTITQPASSSSKQVSNSSTTSTTNTTPSSSMSSDPQLMTGGLDTMATTSQAVSSDVADPAKAGASSSETGTSLMETGGETPSEDLVEQTTVLPEGTTIMQLEDGTFLLQKPDGTAMQIQTPDGMTIETVQALLSMEGGAIETVEEPSPQYILDDGSCVQLPAGMSLDMAVEMGLINQSTD